MLFAGLAVYMGALFVELWPAHEDLMRKLKATCAADSEFVTSEAGSQMKSLDK